MYGKVGAMMALRKIVQMLLLGTVIIVITGCGAGASEPTEEPLLAETQAAVVSATGVVVPAQWVALGFPISGRVVSLVASEGDVVSVGDVLAELDPVALDAAVAGAEAALAMDEAELARLQLGPREEEIQQAEAQLEATQADLAAAIARRDDLHSGATEAEIAAAQAEVTLAQISQYSAEGQYDYSISRRDDRYGDTPPEDYAEHEREALSIANENLAAAQAYLDELLAGPEPDQLRVTEAQVWGAAAQRDVAQASLDLLLAGPRPEDIAIAEAQVEQARMALESAIAARNQATLLSPFGGVVTAVHIRSGEWAAPGQSVVTLADLSTLRVETTDLNEIDIARVEVGDSVTVTFDSLPDVTVTGVVTHVAPRAGEGAGVNYTATIELVEEIPSSLRWGMTAFVDIEVES